MAARRAVMAVLLVAVVVLAGMVVTTASSVWARRTADVDRERLAAAAVEVALLLSSLSVEDAETTLDHHPLRSRAAPSHPDGIYRGRMILEGAAVHSGAATSENCLSTGPPCLHRQCDPTRISGHWSAPRLPSFAA